MQLQRYRPWGDLALFRDGFGGLLGDFFGEDAPTWPARRALIPALDVVETEKSLIVKADLPGLEKDDLRISITDDILTIQGEKKAEKEEKGKDFRRLERAYGTFSRSVRLPREVDQEKVKASYRNGVLEIDLSKGANARSREIEVKVR